MADSSPAADRILDPLDPISAADVESAPASPGIYSWWFRGGALDVPEADYRCRNEYELLYIGISPSRASSAGTLRRRLRQHVRDDASRSTLRMTLGVLLTQQLGLTLELNRGRATYGQEGEARITRWLVDNARVAWAIDPTPWAVERELLASSALALNISGRDDDFVRSLSARRSEALRVARGGPVGA